MDSNVKKKAGSFDEASSTTDARSQAVAPSNTVTRTQGNSLSGDTGIVEK